MSRNIRAVVFRNPGEITVETMPLPPLAADEILVETEYSFVSPGTELRILAGTKESKGRFPVIPGYSIVGKIIGVGAGVRGWSEGEWVTGRNPVFLPGITSLWGGQASHHRYKISNDDRPVRLPVGADPWAYVMAEVASISWRGVSVSMPAPGETAVVIGQGMIGALAARFLIHLGARVIVTDLEEGRLKRALAWGAAAAVNGRDADAGDRLKALCGKGADLAIEASASATGAVLAREILRETAQNTLRLGYRVDQLRACASLWPRLVYLATYTKTIEATPNGLVRGEGAIVLSPGDRTIDDREAVIEMIARGVLKTSDFLAEATPVEEAPSAYLKLRDHPDELTAVAFSWR